MINPMTDADVGTMLYDWNGDRIGWIIDTRDIGSYGVTYWKVEFADGLIRHASFTEVYRMIQDYEKLRAGGSRRPRI